jgi:hypothetical protein
MPTTTGAGPSHTLRVRLDASLRDQLAGFMSANEFTASQAVRVLLRLALRQSGEDPQAVLRAALVREGLLKGLGDFKRKLNQLLSEEAA